ncbi:Wzz/FepE/Etk N-terminal domain-containing protein [Streptococcus azizii]
MNKQVNTEFEIDLLALFRAVWRKKFFILAVSSLVGVLAFGYQVLLATPQYESTSRIYVVNRQNNELGVLTNQDLQAGSYLVKDYREIILSQSVLQEVIDDLDLELTSEGLAKKIKVTIPTETRIISITVSDPNPETAARIVNLFRQKASEKMIEVTKASDVTTVDEGVAATTPSSPKVKRNTLLAFLASALLMVLIVLMTDIIDDRVRKPEDIEEAMNIPLLGVVPHLDTLQ